MIFHEKKNYEHKIKSLYQISNIGKTNELYKDSIDYIVEEYNHRREPTCWCGNIQTDKYVRTGDNVKTHSTLGLMVPTQYL